MGWFGPQTGSCSCCPTTCVCVCENCKDGQAPCCWKVTIAGIVEGTCGDCASLNRTYYLQQSVVDDCVWSNRCVLRGGECDPDEISLTVTGVGDKHYITVTLGGHVWEKEYDAAPDCCDIASELLPHKTNSGDCDSSSATCVVTAHHTACLSLCCDAVAESPDAVRISLEGMANDDCKHCTCLNSETHYLVQTSDCTWRTKTIYCGWCESAIAESEGLQLTITVITEGDPVTRTGVRVDVDYGVLPWITTRILWSTEFWDDTNPFSWDGESIDYDSDVGSLCDATGSTLTLYSASGAGSSYDTTDRSMACDDCGTSGPSQVQVDIDGVEDGICSADCEGFDNTYILDEYQAEIQRCKQEWRVGGYPDVPGCGWPCGTAAIIGVKLQRYTATKAKLTVWIPVGVAAKGWWAEWIRYIDMAVDCGGFDVTLTDADRTQIYIGVCGGGGGQPAFCDFSGATVRVRAV